MTFTPDDIKRLFPEVELQKLINLIVIICNEKPDSRIEAALAHALLTTRRQLEIAMEALIVYDYCGGDIAREALESIKELNHG